MRLGAGFISTRKQIECDARPKVCPDADGRHKVRSLDETSSGFAVSMANDFFSSGGCSTLAAASSIPLDSIWQITSSVGGATSGGGLGDYLPCSFN